jgi:hypothetical protein
MGRRMNWRRAGLDKKPSENARDKWAPKSRLELKADQLLKTGDKPANRFATFPKSNSRTVEGRGDKCPRCGRFTIIKEHIEITVTELRQRYYFRRWFVCANRQCDTTMIMPPRFIVWNLRQPKKEK